MSTASNDPPARRGRPGYDREGLLDVATEVFIRRGYEGTSMEDLSQTLGISKSAIYHHVRGKEELLQLALDKAIDGLFAVTDEAKQINGPAIARLEHLVAGSVAVLVDRLPFVTLLLRVRGNTEVQRAAVAQRRAFDMIVAELVQQAADEGDLRDDIDPKLTARLMFGMINSVVEWYTPDGELDADHLAEAVTVMALDSLRVRRASDRP